MPRATLVLAGLWSGAALAAVAVWWALASWVPSHPRARPAGPDGPAYGRGPGTAGRRPEADGRAAVRPQIPAAGTISRGQTWTLVRQISAHHVLVLEVETEAPHEARAIARQLIEPLKGRYSEALIYFSRPSARDRLADRRIQWTPKGGYIEMVFH